MLRPSKATNAFVRTVIREKIVKVRWKIQKFYSNSLFMDPSFDISVTVIRKNQKCVQTRWLTETEFAVIVNGFGARQHGLILNPRKLR